MKKFASNLWMTIEYFRKKLVFNVFIFNFSVCLGMLIFKDERIPINPTSQNFYFLLMNNFIVCLIIIVSGILSFGFLGNFILVANSVVLGRIIIGVFNEYGITPLIRYIAPHFIFEITALLIATAISQEPNKFFYNLRHSDIKIVRIRYNLFAFATMVSLLLVAAFIESCL